MGQADDCALEGRLHLLSVCRWSNNCSAQRSAIDQSASASHVRVRYHFKQEELGCWLSSIPRPLTVLTTITGLLQLCPPYVRRLFSLVFKRKLGRSFGGMMKLFFHSMCSDSSMGDKMQRVLKRGLVCEWQGIVGL